MKEKKIILSIIIIIAILLFMLVGILFLFNTFDNDKSFCLDSGICVEGLELNTEYGLVKINEENCKKYNWKWDAENKRCNVND